MIKLILTLHFLLTSMTHSQLYKQLNVIIPTQNMGYKTPNKSAMLHVSLNGPGIGLLLFV